MPTYFKANFEHDLTYWRDKKLLTASAHEIESFALKHPRLKSTAHAKTVNGLLTTAKDEELPGDIENIDNLLTAATFLYGQGLCLGQQDRRESQGRAQGCQAASSA